MTVKQRTVPPPPQVSRLRYIPERLRRWGALLATPRAAAMPSSTLERDFIARCAQFEAPRVLELGTLQSVPGRSTLHRDWVPHSAEFLGTDIEAGPDVDIVADLHRLSEVVGRESFDVILSCSTFEHLKYPTLAAHEIMKSLRIGGVLFVQTHQSFPLHGYPSDYFRFSEDALASLFGTAMGFRTIATDYDFPVRLYARRTPGTQLMPAFLNTILWGEKESATPDDYQYELP
jgi:SAM-dependent methyltransferase